ncbi:hypothetical protein C8R44DRAFT_742717 [Mycena epipterygia]|nr:hypothetical protein C8R44DRAFT_742717 [Mycena epipterygia]
MSLFAADMEDGRTVAEDQYTQVLKKPEQASQAPDTRDQGRHTAAQNVAILDPLVVKNLDPRPLARIEGKLENAIHQRAFRGILSDSFPGCHPVKCHSVESGGGAKETNRCGELRERSTSWDEMRTSYVDRRVFCFLCKAAWSTQWKYNVEAVSTDFLFWNRPAQETELEMGEDGVRAKETNGLLGSPGRPATPAGDHLFDRYEVD